MLPITSKEFVDITRCVGFAVWQLQLLEQVAACYLILVHKTDPTTAREQVQTMFAKAEKKHLANCSVRFAIQAKERQRFSRDWKAW